MNPLEQKIVDSFNTTQEEKDRKELKRFARNVAIVAVTTVAFHVGMKIVTELIKKS